MPYPNEHACRLRDPADLEIVGSGERKTDGKTYRVIFGKPKGGDGSVEQAYRYPVEGWSEAEARRHCEAHDGRFEPATKEAGLQLKYFAAVQAIEEREGRHYARIYLMDTSLNRNNWRVTSQALSKALNTLLGKPLTARLGYRTNHAGQPLNTGAFVQVDKPDGYALGVAEITDRKAWEKLDSGEWGPVSVEITAHKVTCSRCGREVLNAPDEHIRSGEAHEVIHDFTFNRVAFVDKPAYPKAGVLVFDGLEQSRLQTWSALTAKEKGGMLQGAVKTAGVIPFAERRKAPRDESWDFDAAEYNVDQLKRACAWFDSENPDVKDSYKLPHHRPDGTVVWRGVAAAMQVLLGARGGVDIPADDRRGVYSHLRRHYAQFDKEPPEFQAEYSHISDEDQRSLGSEKIGEMQMSGRIAELENRLEAVTAENKQLKAKLEEAQGKLAEKAGIENQVKDLQAKLDKMEEERHLERVAELVDLRIQAGLAKDRDAEIEKYKTFDDQTLEVMKGDVEVFIAEKQRFSKLAGPKAKFTAEQQDQVKAKMEEIRMRYFGHKGTPGAD